MRWGMMHITAPTRRWWNTSQKILRNSKHSSPEMGYQKQKMEKYALNHPAGPACPHGYSPRFHLSPAGGLLSFASSGGPFAGSAQSVKVKGCRQCNESEDNMPTRAPWEAACHLPHHAGTDKGDGTYPVFCPLRSCGRQMRSDGKLRKSHKIAIFLVLNIV